MTQVNDRAAELTAWFHERFPDVEQLKREMRSSRASAEWLSHNYARLLDELGEQWVAVLRCEVRAVAASQEAVLDSIARDGLPRHEVVVEKLVRDRPVLIA